MLVAFWIPKATSAYSEYVIPIAYTLQQWLHERASLLRFTYIDWLLLCVNTHKDVRGSGSMGGGRRLVDQP